MSKPAAMTAPSGPGGGEDGELVMRLAPVTRARGLHDRPKGSDLFRVVNKEGQKQDVAFTSRPCSHTLDSESHKAFSFLGRVQGPESFRPGAGDLCELCPSLQGHPSPGTWWVASPAGGLTSCKGPQVCLQGRPHSMNDYVSRRVYKGH